ncbi:MAG TPA: beta-propeller fold lactonase family protein [Granulicella sp.]|jgi:6-phosphogluconolactonase (cycloisomerase 2 family)
MLKAVRNVLTIALSAGAFTSTMHAADNSLGSASTVFVMTNDTVKNEVLAYQRLFDGRLTLKERFATGGRGSGGTTDPLQSQGSLTLSHDHSLLFAINSGSGTISSFHLLGGLPILVDQEPTGGSEPVAVAEHNGIVYVLNAGGNGAVVAFRADALGLLHEISNSTVHLTATHSGGSSISVSPDGKTLAVIEKVPNNIDTLPIHADGTLGSIVINHSVTPGVFAAVFTPNGQLIVSENQPNGTDVSSISSYTINADGTVTAITQSLPSFGDGNCWNAITPNGKYIYADNSATSTVAGFSVAANGTLTPIAGTILSSNPAGTTNLDMAVSTDGKFLYTMDSGTGSVGIYSVNSDGTLISLGDIDGLPKTVGFNGIAAL